MVFGASIHADQEQAHGWLTNQKALIGSCSSIAPR